MFNLLYPYNKKNDGTINRVLIKTFTSTRKQERSSLACDLPWRQLLSKQ